jgi:hypothetical protein
VLVVTEVDLQAVLVVYLVVAVAVVKLLLALCLYSKELLTL